MSTTPEIYMPTREDIEALKVGDVAPYAFGQGKVASISCRREDMYGRLYVLYYVHRSPTSQMSASMKEGEIVRSLAATREHTSAELRDIERAVRAERGDFRGCVDGNAAIPPPL
jgi:hypothetical protein